MREAMASAIVGDDAGEDPTVIELQERMASIMGKEAGLMVPSGTMANAIAIRTHTQPGDEIITEEHSHVYVYEAGGFAALSGCSVALVHGERGIMQAESVKAKIRKPSECSSHYPNGSLVCIENTSNRGGGTFYPQSAIDKIAELARNRIAPSWTARLFNAAEASGEDPAKLFVIAIPFPFAFQEVGHSRRGCLGRFSASDRPGPSWRKAFGGGMGQAGCWLRRTVCSTTEPLSEDHAQRAVPWLDFKTLRLKVDLESVQTSMIYLQDRPSVRRPIGYGVAFWPGPILSV